MGTNYYAEPSIQGIPVRLHIGKSSVGWKFLFAEYSNLQSWAAWREFLSIGSVRIVDEYNSTVLFSDLCNLVQMKQKPTNLDYLNASSEMWGPFDDREKIERLDDAGYRFSRSDPEDWF